MVPLTPPQAPPTWKHTVQDVDKLITEALTKKKKVIGDIVGLPEDKLGIENVFSVLALAEAELKSVSELLRFYQNVSGDKELRDASTAADQRTCRYLNEELMREDLYKAETIAEANVRKTSAWDQLSGEKATCCQKDVTGSSR